MPETLHPGVYIEEVPSGARTITGLSTSVTAFVGGFARGPLDAALQVASFSEFEREFGGRDTASEASYAVQQFFLNGGREAWVVRVAPESAADLCGVRLNKTGIYALEDVETFNLLCIPGAAPLGNPAEFTAVYSEAIAYCRERHAFLLIDIPPSIDSAAKMRDWVEGTNLRDRNAAVYFPRVKIPDRLSSSGVRVIGPGGAMAGVYARTDVTRGVWKAPAGVEATLPGVSGLEVTLADAENGELSRLGVNCLRQFPSHGHVAWGARTLEGADSLNSEWKYIPVRRLALFLEESLYQGTKWAVFEPNGEPLWSLLRQSVGLFLHGLFRQGAFQGTTPREAYFVKCDSSTTTQDDVDQGRVNILLGFAPLKPGEFIILRLTQLAGENPAG